jgi:hypothetical protein
MEVDALGGAAEISERAFSEGAQVVGVQNAEAT